MNRNFFWFFLAATPVLLNAAISTGMWRQINPKLDDLVELEEERSTLPDSRWFGRDKEKNLEDIESLLNQAVTVLGGSTAADIRREIESLIEANQKLRKDIADYRRKRLSAPESSLFSKTQAGLDQRIKSAEAEILANENRIAEQKIAFADALGGYGLELGPEQVDLLLNSVIGSEIVQSVAVYENVKQVSIRLAELTASSQEDIDISRRYYAMHVVLLKILGSMQSDFVRQIDEVYLPRINRIQEDVETLQKESRRIYSRTDNDAHRSHLQANLQSQALTLRTADLYREHLRDQRGKMDRALRQTRQDIEVAENTYRTVTASGELVSMIRSTQNSFDTLASIQVPELLVFENLQMKEEFASLTQRLND